MRHMSCGFLATLAAKPADSPGRWRWASTQTPQIGSTYAMAMLGFRHVVGRLDGGPMTATPTGGA